MKKSHNAFTEHYLVPVVLVLLNICLAHVIYAFTGDAAYTPIGKTVLTVSLVFFAVSLSLKKQTLLGGSLLFYAVVALWV